jgi:cytochrome c551/c552
MTQQFQRTIQHCPVCGVAMLGSKSHQDRADFDQFSCLQCHAVMTLGPSADPRQPGKKP